MIQDSAIQCVSCINTKGALPLPPPLSHSQDSGFSDSVCILKNTKEPRPSLLSPVIPMIQDSAIQRFSDSERGGGEGGGALTESLNR